MILTPSCACKLLTVLMLTSSLCLYIVDSDVDCCDCTGGETQLSCIDLLEPSRPDGLHCHLTPSTPTPPHLVIVVILIIIIIIIIIFFVSCTVHLLPLITSERFLRWAAWMIPTNFILLEYDLSILYLFIYFLQFCVWGDCFQKQNSRLL